MKTPSVGYFVVTDVANTLPRKVLEILDFPRTTLNASDTRWTQEHANRRFRMEMRFGGDWALTLNDPLCMRKDCASATDALLSVVETEALARQLLQRLAVVTNLTLSDVQISAPAENLITASANIVVDGHPVIGTDLRLSVNTSGQALFGGGMVGPFEKSPEIRMRSGEELQRAIQSAAPGADSAVQRIRLVYARFRGRGWGGYGIRPLDVAPIYEVSLRDGSTVQVEAANFTRAQVGGPVPQKQE